MYRYVILYVCIFYAVCLYVILHVFIVLCCNVFILLCCMCVYDYFVCVYILCCMCVYDYVVCVTGAVDFPFFDIDLSL